MFYPVSEFPMHGAGPVTRYPGQWDDKQVMAACCALFTPASGAFSGRQTAFLYYRATDDLLSGPGSVQIGVMTADPADLDGLNWNRQRGLNPIIPANAVASAPVLGGDYNDMTVVEYAGKLRLFVNIYGNPAGSNRMVVFESATGLAFTYLQEVQHGGTHFGATCGPIWNVAGTLWGLFSQAAATGGNKKRLRSSADGGLSWTDHGTAIELSTDPKAWDSHSLIVGRPFPWAVGDSHVYALIPGMRNIGTDGGGSPYSDWPEAIGLYRCAVDQLGQPGSWQRYPRPVMMRGPLDGGIWQLAPLVIGREVLATYQAWSMADFDNIASADMATLRSQPYAGVTEGWSTKHIYTARLGGRAALDDWATDPLPAGAVYLRHVATGAFLAIEGGRAVLSAEAPQVFTHASEGGFSTLTAGSTRLRAPSLKNRAQIEASADDLTGDPLNLKAHWLINLREDQAGVPPLVWVQSRHSSLALAVRRGTDRSGIAIEQRPYVGAADMLWELVAHRPAGTTEDVVATPWPSDDILRTTWSQTVTNKTLEVISRAEAVTRNGGGAYGGLMGGKVIFVGGHLYERLIGSTAIADFGGWQPWGGMTTVPAAQFFATKSSADDMADRLQAMIDWAAGQDRPVVLDCSGYDFRLGHQLVPQNATDVVFLAGKVRPHANWTTQAHWATPPTRAVWDSPTNRPDPAARAINALFDLRSGVGRFHIMSTEFDGRPETGPYAGQLVADFVSWRAGSGSISRVKGTYFRDYGIWNSGGNNQKIWKCELAQYKFGDWGNSDHASRTGAGIVVASGDCEVEFCLASYCAFPLVCIGTVGHIRFNHFFNGVPDETSPGVPNAGTVTTNKQHCVLCWDGAGANLVCNQLDKGGYLFVGKVASMVWGGEVHIDDTFGTQGLSAVTLRPIEANTKLNGFRFRDVLIIGKDGPSNVPLTSARFMVVDTALGGSYATEDAPNIDVSGNLYRAGSKVVDQVPAMRGTRMFEIRSDYWTWDAGVGLWKTAIIDIAASMFLPDLFPWDPLRFDVCFKLASGARPPAGEIWAQKTGTGAYRLWSDMAPAGGTMPGPITLRLGWDYADTRKAVLGSTTGGTTHYVRIYGAPRIPVLPVYTVATLPAAATAGMGARAYVTDATATTFAATVAGGGANKVPVTSDGTAWKIG